MIPKFTYTKLAMTQSEFLDEVKSFCSNKSFRYIGYVPIGRDILILILGDNCADALKQFLEDLGVKHTTPRKMDDGIGSYVTL